MCFNRPAPPRPITPERIVRTFRPISPVAREVRLIHRLQEEAISQGNNLPCGNRTALGAPERTFYNTRPFILYLQNGEEFSIRCFDTPQTTNTNSIVSNNPTSPSRLSVFRVEEVNGNTAIIRGLRYVLGKAIATCQCATVNLDDFVGIQTLTDTFVSNLRC